MAKKARKNVNKDNGELTPDAENGHLFETDNTPPRVKRAGTAYKNACKAKADANQAWKNKKDSLMTAMEEEGVEVFPIEIDGVRKLIRLVESEDLKIEAMPKNPTVPDAVEV